VCLQERFDDRLPRRLDLPVELGAARVACSTGIFASSGRSASYGRDEQLESEQRSVKQVGEIVLRECADERRRSGLPVADGSPRDRLAIRLSARWEKLSDAQVEAIEAVLERAA